MTKRNPRIIRETPVSRASRVALFKSRTEKPPVEAAAPATEGKVTKEKKRNMLTFVQQRKLAVIVEEEYTASGKSDEAFAEQVNVSARIDFAVTEGNIRGMRVSLGIKSNVEAMKDAAPATIIGRLEVLEKMVEVLARDSAAHKAKAEELAAVVARLVAAQPMQVV